MQPDIIPNLPRQQRMLLGRVVADQQNRRRIEYVPHTGRGFPLSRKSRYQGREVRSAMVVDVVSTKNHASELLQQVVFFVCRAVRAENPDRVSSRLIADFLEPPSDQFEGFFP